MKKIIIASLLVLGIILIPSCNDDFMQQDSKDDFKEGEYLTKVSDLPIYLDGLYRYYIYGHGIGGTNSTAHDKGWLAVKSGSQIIYGDVYSDNVVYAGAIDGKLNGSYETPNSAPGTTEFNAPWSWFKLKKVNYFLRNSKMIETTNPTDSMALIRWTAEAHFFKAWDYYIKLVALGEVPWLYEDLTVESPELYSERMRREELVNNIMASFKYAEENIAPENSLNKGPSGRINKDMILFLKAKFCLFEGTFRQYHANDPDFSKKIDTPAELFLQASADAAKQILDKTSKYQLYKDEQTKDSYWKLFAMKQLPETDGNREDILARVYNGSKLGNDNPRYFGMNNHTRYAMGAPVAALEDYLCEDGQPIYLSGVEGNYVNNPLFKGYDGMWEELDNRDPRLTQTICKPGEYASVFNYAKGTYGIDVTGIIYPMITHTTGGTAPMKMYNSTVTGYRFIKHWIPEKPEWDANSKGKQTAHMFRLAEAMLIYAEARAELGLITNDDLELTINKLRARAGYDFVKYPNARLTLQNIPNDPRLDKIYRDKLENAHVPSPILREIRRERRVELMLEGSRYEDLLRWKAGRLMTVPRRGMKMTEEKIALYGDNREDKKNPVTGILESAPMAQVGNDVVIDENAFIIPWPSKSDKIDKGILPWNDRRYYYPIPLNELLMNKKLTQNPGWKSE